VEGERKEFGGSVGKKVREGKIKLSKHERKTSAVKKHDTTRRKLLTSGRVWSPLNGFTWQEEGTS
jgi:hypothetical protein